MTLYLDTSSLVKLFVEEAGSDEVRELVGEATVVTTSIVAYAETRATLARLRRSRDLTPGGLARAKRDFEAQWPSFLALDVSPSLSREAGELAERYALRGFDALHLASFAEVVRRSADRDRRFSSFDERLNAASQKLLKEV
jgi:predicted nucleic acid-binding protein